MAIDTAQKRRSVSGIAFRKRAPGITPQAAKSAAWRTDAGRTYSGNVAGYSTGGDDGWLPYYVRRRHHRR